MNKGSGHLIHQLIHRDDWEELRRVLSGWEPNHVALFRWGRDQYTVLHLMALRTPKRAGVAHMVQWLVGECGCDVNARNEKTETPLWLAVGSYNKIMTNALIKAGADMWLHVCDRSRRMSMSLESPKMLPLHAVAKGGDVARALLIAGYEPWQDWQIKWLDRRWEIMNSIITLIGMWSKRQPFAMCAVDRNIIKKVANMLFILGRL